MTKEEILLKIEEFAYYELPVHVGEVRGLVQGERSAVYAGRRVVIKDLLDQYAKAHADSIIPPEKPMSIFSFRLEGEELERYMRYKGWNQCRAEMKDKNL